MLHRILSQHVIRQTRVLLELSQHENSFQHHGLISRSLNTSGPLFVAKPVSDSGGSLPVEEATNGSIAVVEDVVNTDVTEISQIALETGSNTGLAFISNNIMNTYHWLKGFFSSDSAYVWNDVVTHKLTHLYIPSIYEIVQYNTGVSWFVVIGSGTLTLRLLLLPLTRRSMRFPVVVRTVMPQMKVYEDLVDIYTKQKDQKRAKKLNEWKNQYVKSAGVGAVVPSLLATSFIMVALNRGMRHLAHITPLMYGGMGPFLDMSVNSHSGVGFYFLPLCITGAMASITHMNLRHEKWYNPRLALVAVPVGGIFTYFLSAMPVTMTLHYAISSWCTFFLNYSSHHDSLRNLLRLPVPYRAPAAKPQIQLSQNIAQLRSIPSGSEEGSLAQVRGKDSGSGSDSGSGIVQSERRLLEEFMDVKEGEEKAPLHFQTPVTPFFKLGQVDESEQSGNGGERRIENVQVPAKSGGVMTQLSNMRARFQFWRRFKSWYHRQKLMRHGKKGKMTTFLDEAPQETIFIKEAIQLTTKVTPGLRRYVLRRQYPMNTLEELERKVSYMERVQGPRW